MIDLLKPTCDPDRVAHLIEIHLTQKEWECIRDYFFYKAKIYNDTCTEYANYIIKAKWGGIQHMVNEGPVFAVLEFKDANKKLDDSIDNESFYFIECFGVWKI